jgi:hypothetical protein
MSVAFALSPITMLLDPEASAFVPIETAILFMACVFRPNAIEDSPFVAAPCPIAILAISLAAEPSPRAMLFFPGADALLPSAVLLPPEALAALPKAESPSLRAMADGPQAALAAVPADPPLHSPAAAHVSRVRKNPKQEQSTINICLEKHIFLFSNKIDK